MDEDTGPSSNRYRALAILGIVLWIALIVWFYAVPHAAETATDDSHGWSHNFSPRVLMALVCLLALSAFFSASETAFFSINKIRLLSMAEDKHATARLVARMLAHPGKLLTTILVGNMIVNILIAVFLGTRAVRVLEDEDVLGLNAIAASVLAVAICTSTLLLFGEIAPKVIAMRMGERLARWLAYPLLGADKLLEVLRETLLALTEVLFRLTRFSELRAVPFMTDEEFKSILSEGEANGLLEEEQRHMIQGILEFTDTPLREILVPRPDVVAIPLAATVAEALDLFREHAFARMPVYEDDLDHIKGVVFAKDLIAYVARDETAVSIAGLVKPIQFVPEMMSIYSFVKHVQRRRSHIAVVVDEFGGTEGIVTLEDALEEVVGDMADEGGNDELPYKRLAEGEFLIEGSMALDELSELIGIEIADEEHETVAGFVMSQIDKIPKQGDTISHRGLVMAVESVDGKRVETLRLTVRTEAVRKEETV